MRLEPIEHLVLHLGGNSRPAIGHREGNGISAPLGGKGNDLARGRKAHRIGQQIEERLSHAPLVCDEASDLRRGMNFKRDSAFDQAILHAFGGSFHGLADIHRSQVERHGAGIDAGQVEDIVDDGEQRVG